MAFHRQPLLFPLFGLLAGTLLPQSGVSPWLLSALILAALLSTAAIARPGLVPLSALIAAAAAVGSALATGAQVRYEARRLPESIAVMDGPVVLEGAVASDPRRLDDEMQFDLESERIVLGGAGREYRGRVRLFLRTPTVADSPGDLAIEKGDEIRAWVDLRRPEGVRSPGGFDQAAWAMREGIHGFATCKNPRLVQITRKGRAGRSLLDRARDRLKFAWRHVADPRNRAVTASMVVGDEGTLDVRTREEFRSAGLLHLLVVSGSQVAALLIGLRRAMPLALRITWPGAMLECSVLLAYCFVAGAGDSMVRATVMGMAFAVAARVDLDRGSPNFVWASALVLLAMRPLDAPDPGVQMSFAATLALVSFTGSIARRLEGIRMPGLLRDVASGTLVASMAVAPLTLFHFHRFSLLAVPANLLAAPLAVLLLYGSLATALFDVFSASLASAAGSGCGFAAEALQLLARQASALDPDWRGPSPPLSLILGLLGLVSCAGWRRATLPMAGLLSALTLSAPPSGDGRLHVWFLDVGQGDSILIETPTGRVAAIDAGPAFAGFDAGERIVAEALWELGHRRLAFMSITHRHADHQGGAPFLARHFKPERLYVNGPSSSLADFDGTTVRGGDSWNIDGILFRVLGPEPDWPLPSRDENARSLVIEMRYGATAFLLLGDASVVTESLLDPPGQRYDLVKVGHHGAATSSSDRLVQETRPRVALISVGSRNRFSHPSLGVLAKWSRAGALVWRTDLHQTLHVTSDGKHIEW